MTTRDGLLDADVDLALLGALIAQARREARMTQPFLANKVGTSDRTLSRWESGAQAPAREQLKRLIAALVKANSSTLDDLRHAGHLAPKLTPVPSMASIPGPAAPDAQTALDDLVRAYAEDLDLSARRLRGVLALVLGEIDRLGVPLSTARDLITHSPKRRV